jgi:Fic family protein
VPVPVFSLTPKLVSLANEVSQSIGRFEGLQLSEPQLKLRRRNRARTIHGSAAIEGNSLSLEAVTALIDGKRVLGPPRDILEIQNLRAVYEALPRFRPWSTRDLLGAHKLLMTGLTADAGRWRTRNVGVFRGKKVAHVAPPHALVPRLVEELFAWGRKERENPELIKACVVHYELEFIHPFSDGNGRVGRLWQHLILMRSHPAFVHAPAESLVHQRQPQYYRALADSGRAGNCTPFLEYSLRILRDTLAELLREVRPEAETLDSRLDLARNELAARWFSRSDYLVLHKRLSTATASRDLRAAVERKLVERRGSDRTTTYRFRRR